MKQALYQDENYALFFDSFRSPITKKIISQYKVIPQKNELYMFIEVTEGRFFAKFPEGLSFTGKDGDLWVQAIRNAEAFIEKAQEVVVRQTQEEPER